jgi:hypothetical protein
MMVPRLRKEDATTDRLNRPDVPRIALRETPWTQIYYESQ